MIDHGLPYLTHHLSMPLIHYSLVFSTGYGEHGANTFHIRGTPLRYIDRYTEGLSGP